MRKITIRKIEERDDAALAAIVRERLRQYHLDIPGTAYYDPDLDHLSGYYSKRKETGAYFVAERDDGAVVGGIGVERFAAFDHCGEIQKLYVAAAEAGHGIGQRLLECIESHAKRSGLQRLYLETHSNLMEAVCLYEKNGYRKIDRPKEVVHSTMDLFYLKELDAGAVLCE